MGKQLLSSKKPIFTIKKVKNQKKWNNEEDILLIYLAKKNNERNWKEIASNFANKNPLQCFSRYKRIRPGIKKGTWKKDEDAKILDLVKKYSTSWSKISKEMKSRNGKQIRDRYLNVLDPNINKDKFTQEEDIYLVKLFNTHGPKWAYISKFFSNRTADIIKNRFHSSLKRKMEEKEFPFPVLSCKNTNANSDSSICLSAIESNEMFSHDSVSVLGSGMQIDYEEDDNQHEMNHMFDINFFDGETEQNQNDINEFNWNFDLPLME